MRAGPLTAPTRARPVADAPVGALVDAADEVAKAWLLELVAAAPLSAAGGVRMAELAAEGPELCAAVARALGDDEELERLRGDGDMVALAARAGALAGAADAAAASAAVEALRRAIWDAALGELSRPPAALVADLADRLGAVCAAVVAAVLASPAEVVGAGEAGEREPVLAGAVGASAPRTQHTIRESLSAGGMDRLADLARAAAEEAVQAADLRAETVPIMRPPLDTDAAPEGAPRVTDGDPRTHLAARTAEFVADGRPFAVLLVEIDGLEALLASEHDGEVASALASAESALEDLVRPGDAIRRESDGRLWLTLPGAGPAGARALALRAAAAVERGADHRGRPLSASVGVAVCPRDGADAETLAERVEDDLLAAQAAGTHGAPPPAL
jgi:GGDEF domain-containing protein